MFQAFLAAVGEGRCEQLLQVLHPEVKFTVHTPNGTFVTLGATEFATRARVAGSAAQGHAVTVNGHPGVISWSKEGTPLSIRTPGGRAAMLIPHREPGVEEDALTWDYQRIIAAVRQAAGPVMAREVGEAVGVTPA